MPLSKKRELAVLSKIAGLGIVRTWSIVKLDIFIQLSNYTKLYNIFKIILFLF